MVYDHVVYATPPDCEERPIGAFMFMEDARKAADGALHVYAQDTRVRIIVNGRVAWRNTDPE